MTKRYYYTDALAAAWMSKHFGMRHAFYDERSDLREYETPITGADDEWRADRGRFYVHPDSLDLLRPRVGDVLYTRLGRGGVSIEEIMNEERQGQAHFILKRGGRIIQRDGKAFLAPESEAA